MSENAASRAATRGCAAATALCRAPAAASSAISRPEVRCCTHCCSCAPRRRSRGHPQAKLRQPTIAFCDRNILNSIESIVFRGLSRTVCTCLRFESEGPCCSIGQALSSPPEPRPGSLRWLSTLRCMYVSLQKMFTPASAYVDVLQAALACVLLLPCDTQPRPRMLCSQPFQGAISSYRVRKRLCCLYHAACIMLLWACCPTWIIAAILQAACRPVSSDLQSLQSLQSLLRASPPCL